MSIDLNQLNAILIRLQTDAAVLGKIANDAVDAPNPGHESGTVTTRLGDVVKNIQRVISDIEAAPNDFLRPTVQNDGVDVVIDAASINFSGGSVSVTDVGGVATVSISGTESINVAAAAPAVAPEFIGQRYIDTSVPSIYVATGINNVNDWTRVITPTTHDEAFVVAVSDETTDLEVGILKLTFRMPYAMLLTGVKASLTTASLGQDVIVDILVGRTSILSTPITIDTSTTTSLASDSPTVILSPGLFDDQELTIDIVQVGTGPNFGAGLKVTFIGVRA